MSEQAPEYQTLKEVEFTAMNTLMRMFFLNQTDEHVKREVEMLFTTVQIHTIIEYSANLIVKEMRIINKKYSPPSENAEKYLKEKPSKDE